MTKSKISPSQISPGKGPGQHCHLMVRQIAIEMAGELYDELMGNNEQYAEWKAMTPGRNATSREIMFIEAKWPELIEDARATMATMLRSDLPDDLKQTIFHALLADNELKVHRMAREREKVAPRPTSVQVLH